MFVIPIYDMIILPEVTYYFKQDVFRELNLQEELKEDEEVVFLMLKEDREIGTRCVRRIFSRLVCPEK